LISLGAIPTWVSKSPPLFGEPGEETLEQKKNSLKKSEKIKEKSLKIRKWETDCLIIVASTQYARQCIA